MVRAISRAWEDRGVTDLILGRMPGTLAAALDAEFGPEAATWAKRIETWAARALVELGQRRRGA